MKIVYCSGFKPGFPSKAANNIHKMRMCEALTELGHEVTFVTTSRLNDPAKIFDFFGMNKSFNIHIIKTPIFKGVGYYYLWKALWMIITIKPDLVVSRSVAISALTSSRKLPTIFDSHGPVWETGLINKIAYSYIRKTKNLVRMTTNSLALKNMYLSKNIAPNCGIKVANNGSNIVPLNITPKNWPGRENTMQVGYIGHLYPGRGVEVVISCAKNIPQFDFHIIGGEEKDVDYWRKQYTGSNLFFHGHITHAEVFKHRNACDILLAPYSANNISMAGGGDSSKYMNPIKLFEYMSSKKAIVCSDLPVLHDFLDDGRNALLCKADDLQSWGNAIELLGNKKDLREKISNEAYNDFRAKYTWQARAKRLLGNTANQNDQREDN